MSLKPIDYQSMLPKVNEVSRINAAQQHKQHAFESHVLQGEKGKVENEATQVYKKEKAEEASIKGFREQKEKEQSKKKKKQKHKGKHTKEEGNRIDIRI